MIYTATATLTQTMAILFGRVECVSMELNALQQEMKQIEAKRRQEREQKALQQKLLNKKKQKKSSKSKPMINKPSKIETRQQSQESNTSVNDDDYVVIQKSSVCINIINIIIEQK